MSSKVETKAFQPPIQRPSPGFYPTMVNAIYGFKDQSTGDGVLGGAFQSIGDPNKAVIISGSIPTRMQINMMDNIMSALLNNQIVNIVVSEGGLITQANLNENEKVE